MATKKLLRRALSIPDILSWADDFRQAMGRWPTKDSGGIVATKFETWMRVDAALRSGCRGLPGGGSLSQLLAEFRGWRNVQDLPPLTEGQILTWADAHREKTGSWPTAKSGAVLGAGGEKWSAINQALTAGVRGLPGSSSLPRLLAQHRAARNRKQLAPYSVECILAWADAHFQRTGSWPHAKSGPVHGAPGETWTAVAIALSHGRRGLPGGSSLPSLLAEHRGVVTPSMRPRLAVQEILVWADAFRERTGQWPLLSSGSVSEAPAETWQGIDRALRRGMRCIEGGSSLAKLLDAERGVRNHSDVPRLSRKQIVTWAKAHFQRTGSWPTTVSGPIQEAPDETWAAVDAALTQGGRGLRVGFTLARLLAQHGLKANIWELPRLSQRKILRWADEFYQNTGQWPNTNSGIVLAEQVEKWDLIDNALGVGHRGLPGGSSLLQLLARKRGVRNPLALPPLTEPLILKWAAGHVETFGLWPKYDSGPISGAAGETWASVDSALRYGKRGLAGGSSLAKLLEAGLHR